MENQSEHDNGRRDTFLLQLTLSLPLIKKQPFKSTVIYSSMLSLTERVSVQSAFTESSTEKSLPLLPQRTDILSGVKVSSALSYASSGTSAPTFASRSVCFSDGFYGQLRSKL